MKLYIDIGISQSRLLLMDNDIPVDIYINDHTLKSISGNIYKGRVESMSSSLKCAFISIGEEKNGLLHFSDCIKSPKKGDEVLVQVTREGVGSKGPRLTERITIPSKNMVLLVNECDINISKKIQDKRVRNDLFNIGKDICKGEEGFGVIFRTSCQNLSEEEIKDEFNVLLEEGKKILSTWKYIKGSKKMYDVKDFIEYIKREYLGPKITDVYINSLEEQKDIECFIKDSGYKCTVHNNIRKKESIGIIDSYITKALSRKIETKSGNIVVDETEAFTIIDVNYNKIEGQSSTNNGILSGNLDACRHIASTIKLKNLSGIILIDFINMDSEEDNQRVIDKLNNEFFKKNVKATIHGFTRLSILEVTRAKKSPSLMNSIYSSELKNGFREEYYLRLLENELLKESIESNIKEFTVYISEDIYKCCASISFEKIMNIKYNITLTLQVKKDLKGYIIKDNFNDSYARVSIGSKNIIGRVLNLKEEGENIQISIRKHQ